MQNSRLAQRKIVIVKHKKKFPVWILLIPVVILVLIVAIVAFIFPSVWDGKNKQVIAVQKMERKIYLTLA